MPIAELTLREDAISIDQANKTRTKTNKSDAKNRKDKEKNRKFEVKLLHEKKKKGTMWYDIITGDEFSLQYSISKNML